MIVRRDPNGDIDELITGQVDRVHLERMGVGRVALMINDGNTYAILEICRGKITLVEQGTKNGHNP